MRLTFSFCLLFLGSLILMPSGDTFAQRRTSKSVKNKKIKKPKGRDKANKRTAFPRTITGKTRAKRKDPIVGSSPKRKSGQNFVPPRKPRSATGTTRIKRKNPVVGSSPKKRTGENFVPPTKPRTATGLSKVKRKDPIVGQSPRKRQGDNFVAPKKPRSITGTMRVERKDPIVGRPARKVEGSNYVAPRPVRSISGTMRVERKDPIVGRPPQQIETPIRYKKVPNKFQNITAELSCGPKSHKRIKNKTSSLDCSVLYARYQERAQPLKLDGKMIQDKFKVKKVKYDKKEGKIWYY